MSYTPVYTSTPLSVKRVCQPRNLLKRALDHEGKFINWLDNNHLALVVNLMDIHCDSNILEELKHYSYNPDDPLQTSSSSSGVCK